MIPIIYVLINVSILATFIYSSIIDHKWAVKWFGITYVVFNILAAIAFDAGWVAL